ncbi:hypothetical protein B0T13DRAFT_447982 [Neurospora crassa]|nr:hypothetical protein B0T13DRAFT_447982 [Neurospora crassa]
MHHCCPVIGSHTMLRTASLDHPKDHGGSNDALTESLAEPQSPYTTQGVCVPPFPDHASSPHLCMYATSQWLSGEPGFVEGECYLRERGYLHQRRAVEKGSRSRPWCRPLSFWQILHIVNLGDNCRTGSGRSKLPVRRPSRTTPNAIRVLTYLRLVVTQPYTISALVAAIRVIADLRSEDRTFPIQSRRRSETIATSEPA